MRPEEYKAYESTPTQTMTDRSATQPPSGTQQAPATSTNKPVSVPKALFIMFGPAILIVATIILYAIFNFIFGFVFYEPSVEGSAFTESNVFLKVINILLFLIGAVSVVAMLPCFILGIILLARR